MQNGLIPLQAIRVSHIHTEGTSQIDKALTLLTSESVTEGHPDKMCDMISDALRICLFKKKIHAIMALETMASEDTVFIAGEVASFAKVDVKNKAREIICEMILDEVRKRNRRNECLILTNIRCTV
ncbi:MAG: S-adenosylmethionine synthetase N-terminal domain-containing protein [Anaerobutyricum sp.]